MISEKKESKWPQNNLTACAAFKNIPTSCAVMDAGALPAKDFSF